MARKRDVIARVGADTTDFDRGMKNAGRELDQFAALGRKAGLALAAGMGAATAAVVAFTARGIELGDELAKTSRALGVTVDQLAGLRHAGKLAGVETGDLDRSLSMLARTVGEADAGAAEYQKTLARLGLESADLRDLPIDEQMLRVADAMVEVKNQTDRVAIAQKLFGESGARLLPLLEQGSDAMRAQAAEARELGLTLTDVQARGIEAASDAMERLRASGDGLALQLAASLSPAITAIADGLREELAGALGDSREDVVGWGETVGDVIAFSADAALGAVRTISAGFQSAGTTLGAGMAQVTALVVGDFDRLSAIGQEWAADQAEIWSGLANDANLRTFRDRLAEIRANLAAGDSDEQLQAERTGAEEMLRIRQEVADDSTAIELLLFETFAGIEEQKSELRQKEFDEMWRNVNAELEALEMLDEKRKETTAGWIDNLLIEIAAEEEHARRSRQIRQQVVSQYIGGLSQAFNAVSQHNKKLFDAAKIFAAAEAGLNAYRAIQQVWADETLPFYAKVAATAITAASTAANIAAINRTTFGGGTTPAAAGVPTVGGAPVAQATQPARETTVFVQGISRDSLISGDQVRTLIERINESIKDGGRIILAN